MGPHMLTFSHSCYDEAHTPSEFTPNHDVLPFTQDSFRRFENTSFPSPVTIYVIASLISPLVPKKKVKFDNNCPKTLNRAQTHTVTITHIRNGGFTGINEQEAKL